MTTSGTSQSRTPLNGALLINKHEGISSFGVIEQLQHEYMERHGVKRRDVPKLGHGGTLDPFATGLLAICVGRAVKLARYFLGSTKVYEGTIRFGESTVPGDPTSPVTERSEVLPASIEELRAMASKLEKQPYLQTPPMHSAKKKDGKPLYELARQGLEVERDPKLCHLYRFDILSYEKPRAEFRLTCSSGTYVRTLSQDYARMLGTVGMLDRLDRTKTGAFDLANAWTISQIREASAKGMAWDEMPCWIPFDRLLAGYDSAEATREERDAIFQGRQGVLFNILKRARSAGGDAQFSTLPGQSEMVVGQEDCLAIYTESQLVAIARKTEGVWSLERVFV